MGGLSESVQHCQVWHAANEDGLGFLPTKTVDGITVDNTCSWNDAELGKSRENMEGSNMDTHMQSAVATGFHVTTGSDVLQYLCANVYRENGLSKSKVSDPFLRLLNVSETQDKSQPIQHVETHTAPARRHRKGYKPSRVPPTAEPLSMDSNGDSEHTDLKEKSKLQSNSMKVCKNLACKAHISSDASFCRRCSCCLCKQFDDNKDPSLWITCNMETDGPVSCGLSCHIECAITEHVAGVIIKGSTVQLDGSYCCQFCGATTSLLGCWKKQLLYAKEARRVDILCHRLFLSYRILDCTLCYEELHLPISKAVRLLEAEIGPLADGAKLGGRGIVNRLACNAEVQKLISLALEKVDDLSFDTHAMKEAVTLKEHEKAACNIHFEDVTPCSITVAVDENAIGLGFKPLGYRLWHCKGSDSRYGCTPTCIIPGNVKKAVVSNLLPSTEYSFKVAPFSEKGDGEHCEGKCCTKAAKSLERDRGQCSSSMVVPSITDKLQSNTCLCPNQSGSEEHKTNAWKMEHPMKDTGEVLIDEVHNVNGSQHLPGHELKGPLPDTQLNSSNQNLAHELGVERVVNPDVSDVQINSQPSGSPDFSRANKTPKVKGCQGVASQAAECLARMPSSSPESEQGRKHIVTLEPGRCIQSRDLREVCVNDITASYVDSKFPCQSWAMQIHSKETGTGLKPQASLVSKRTVQGLERMCSNAINCGNNADSCNFDLSVKVIRWLECEGHLKKDFRMKFLTWYSLRASEHEKRVVSVYIDTFQDDPAGLAGQLMDTFADIVASKRQCVVPEGYYSLW